MKRMGNMESNRLYNPESSKPPIPIDADEADSAMERFIRQKYQRRPAQSQRRHYSGSSSDEGPPPPLPPKPTSRFGFRSASSIFPLSSKNRTNSAPPVETPRNNKQSKVFGASVGPDEMEAKLVKLKEMGFLDNTKNAAVLKGLGGNMEKSIETLTRIGEGGSVRKAEPKFSPKQDSFESAGISIDRSQSISPERSNNPFDALDNPPPIAQPQSTQSTGGNPYQSQSTNPFGLNPSQSQYSLPDAFQSMSISHQQQLFPNHTGGFPLPQHQLTLPPQSMTPPVPSVHSIQPSVIYENQIHPSQAPNYNPFMQQAQSQPYSPPQASAVSPFSQPNPFGTMQPNSNPYSNQQQPTSRSAYNNTSPQPQQMNPFFNQTFTHQNPQQSGLQDPNQSNMSQYPQVRQQTYPLMAQQTGMRADKRSILDLYNYPQLAPQTSQTNSNQSSPQMQQSTPPMSNSHYAQPSRSFSSPLATHMEISRNPFMSPPQTTQTPDGGMGSAGPFGQQNGTRQVSRESMAIDGGGWHNGRHSPDAWGTIARSMQ